MMSSGVMCCSTMMWGMGLIGLLLIMLLALGVAALVRYLFRGDR
jgi:hypothetical protein